jgi:hypothetical protein
MMPKDGYRFSDKIMLSEYRAFVGGSGVPVRCKGRNG